MMICYSFGSGATESAGGSYFGSSLYNPWVHPPSTSPIFFRFPLYSFIFSPIFYGRSFEA